MSTFFGILNRRPKTLKKQKNGQNIDADHQLEALSLKRN